jgi:hypothetical protein
MPESLNRAKMDRGKTRPVDSEPAATSSQSWNGRAAQLSTSMYHTWDGVTMKRFSYMRNITDTSVAAGTPPAAARVASTAVSRGVIIGMFLALAAGALMLCAFPGGAQVRAQTGIDSGAAVDRESARRSMESFRNRMRQGHIRGQQRALDTNERVRRDRERQIERLDDLRRQRSR